MSRIYVETSIASFYFKVRQESDDGGATGLDAAMVRCRSGRRR